MNVAVVTPRSTSSERTEIQGAGTDSRGMQKPSCHNWSVPEVRVTACDVLLPQARLGLNPSS